MAEEDRCGSGSGKGWRREGRGCERGDNGNGMGEINGRAGKKGVNGEGREERSERRGGSRGEERRER